MLDYRACGVYAYEYLLVKSTEYLYGISPAELENKMYFEALQYKYDSCTHLYMKLWKMPVKTEEEEERMFYVRKAQEHTKMLLEER